MNITRTEGRKFEGDAPQPPTITITDFGGEELISGQLLRAVRDGDGLAGVSLDGDVLTIEADNGTFRFRVSPEAISTDLHTMELIK